MVYFFEGTPQWRETAAALLQLSKSHKLNQTKIKRVDLCLSFSKSISWKCSLYYYCLTVVKGIFVLSYLRRKMGKIDWHHQWFVFILWMNYFRIGLWLTKDDLNQCHIVFRNKCVVCLYSMCINWQKYAFVVKGNNVTKLRWKKTEHWIMSVNILNEIEQVLG